MKSAEFIQWLVFLSHLFFTIWELKAETAKNELKNTLRFLLIHSCYSIFLVKAI